MGVMKNAAFWMSPDNDQHWQSTFTAKKKNVIFLKDVNPLYTLLVGAWDSHKINIFKLNPYIVANDHG